VNWVGIFSLHIIGVARGKGVHSPPHISSKSHFVPWGAVSQTKYCCSLKVKRLAPTKFWAGYAAVSHLSQKTCGYKQHSFKSSKLSCYDRPQKILFGTFTQHLQLTAFRKVVACWLLQDQETTKSLFIKMKFAVWYFFTKDQKRTERLFREGTRLSWKFCNSSDLWCRLWPRFSWKMNANCLINW